MSISHRRAAGFAALAFFLLMFVRMMLLPSAGEPGEAPAEIRQLLITDADGLLAMNATGPLCALLFIAFALFLTSAARRAGAGREPTMAGLLGATGLLPLVVLENALTAVMTFQSGAIELGTVRVLTDLSWIVETMLLAPIALAIGGLAVSGVRGAQFGRVLGGSGIVVALLCAVGSLSIFRDGPLELFGGLATMGLLGFVLWTLAAGIRLTVGGAVVARRTVPVPA